MKIVKISKRNGKFRTIYIPSEGRRNALRALVSGIARKAARQAPEGVLHGFARGKSPVTNALAHVGHRFTLTMDLQDFFDNVSEKMVQGKLSKNEIEQVFVDGAPRQGLPTSPAVANLAGTAIDKALIKGFAKRKWDVVYTRYADDLAFSFDDPDLAEPLKKFVEQTVARCGFRVHPRKTHLMDARHGRRQITGVMVGEDGIHPSRAMKRRLRAARHQQNEHQAAGLAEWCRLRPPRERAAPGQSGAIAGRDVRDELGALSRVWKVRLTERQIAHMPTKESVVLSGDTIISGDPVYMLGMSTWTTGWTSCMGHPRGQYRSGCVHWMLLRGTRIGALLSKKTKIVAGVERRTMRVRALIHELRNGKGLYYDRIYGNPGDKEELQTELEAAGIRSISKAPRNVKIVGHVDQQVTKRKRPYLDSLKASSATSKKTGNKVWVVHT